MFSVKPDEVSAPETAHTLSSCSVMPLNVKVYNMLLAVGLAGLSCVCGVTAHVWCCHAPLRGSLLYDVHYSRIEMRWKCGLAWPRADSEPLCRFSVESPSGCVH